MVRNHNGKSRLKDILASVSLNFLITGHRSLITSFNGPWGRNRTAACRSTTGRSAAELPQGISVRAAMARDG